MEIGKGICENCGQKFEKHSSNQKYCSSKCKRSFYIQGKVSKLSKFLLQEDKERALKFLKQGPLSRGELSRRLDRSKETVVKIIDSLVLDGYDIEYDRAAKVYTLQTYLKSVKDFHELSSKTLFKSTIKFGQISDTHLGSKYQQLTLLKTAYKIFEEEQVFFVLHAGDLVDGYNLYSGHEQELFLHSADEQTYYTIEYYPKSSNFKTYIISGSHDLSFKKITGYNIIRNICSKREDLVYCGDISASFTINNCRLQIIHPSGGVCYARSYGPQKIVEGIAGDAVNAMREKMETNSYFPHYLAIGHYHVGVMLPGYMGVCVLSSYCMQATTPYLKAKGLYPDVGFQIVTLQFDENNNFVTVLPKFYRLNTHVLEKNY